MNSISCRICEGRLDSRRETILAPDQRYRSATGYDNIRLERFREHANDGRKFHDIDCVVQIQIQIVLISAYEIIDWHRILLIGRIWEISPTQRRANKDAIRNRADYILNCFYNGNFGPLCTPHELKE